MLLHTTKELELLAKQLEVIMHPTWCGAIDEKSTASMLQDSPAMTYLLRQGEEGEYDYWISHKKSSGEIHHRHFTLKWFRNRWAFINTRAPSCIHLNDFIKGALACRN